MSAWLGWMATAVFTASYFATNPQRLRLFQMLGATLWMTYGIALGEAPVIVANLLVLAAASWTSVRAARARTAPTVEHP